MFIKAIPSALLIVVAASCNEVENLLTFRVNDRTAIRIESASPLNLPLEVPTPAVTSTSRQEFENNNTRADLVRDVKLEQLKLTITAPSGKTFSFLKSIRIFISADNLPEITLASLEGIASTSGNLDLNTTSEKLDNYLKASAYDLRTELTTDETLTEDVEVQVDLKFRVTADTF